MRPLAGRWLNLPALTTLAAIDGDEPRCRCTAPAAEQCGFYPPVLPALTAPGAARRLRTATAHLHLAAALATACFTAASITQLGTVHVTDLAPDAEAITLHDWLGQRPAPHAAPRTSLGRPMLLTAAYLQRVTRTDLALLTEDSLSGSGLPGLTTFAEICKLRPPQLPRVRAGTARGGRHHLSRRRSGRCAVPTTTSAGPCPNRWRVARNPQTTPGRGAGLPHGAPLLEVLRNKGSFFRRRRETADRRARGPGRDFPFEAPSRPPAARAAAGACPARRVARVARH